MRSAVSLVRQLRAGGGARPDAAAASSPSASPPHPMRPDAAAADASAATADASTTGAEAANTYDASATATPAPPPVALALSPGAFDARSPACGALPRPAPRTVVYVADALAGGAAAEAQLLAAVYTAPPARWVALRNRRLQVYGGTVTPRGLVGAEPLPPWLAALAAALVAAGAFPRDAPPNHVLVNEYAPGQGILPHTDGPAYFPRTGTLSLGSAALMTLYAAGGEGGGGGEREGGGGGGGGTRVPVAEVLLAPRSLVVFGGAAYARHLHGIGEELTERVGGAAPCVNAPGRAGEVLVRALRVSLTLRHVRPAAAATCGDRGSDGDGGRGGGDGGEGLRAPVAASDAGAGDRDAGAGGGGGGDGSVFESTDTHAQQYRAP